jgi:hypothetical protein
MTKISVIFQIVANVEIINVMDIGIQLNGQTS